MSYVIFKIRRQEHETTTAYWDVFEVKKQPKMTVVSALKAIAKRPINYEGKAVSPVAMSCNCLEETCGACTMIINGQIKQACSTYIDDLVEPIVLEPLSKFRVVRDLVIDRSRLEKDLSRVHAWQRLDHIDLVKHNFSSYESINSYLSELAKCIYCGACVEACPQYNGASNFVGALAIGQSLHINKRSPHHVDQRVRNEILMDKGGTSECQNVQNCTRVCPKEIPVSDAVSYMKRGVMKGFLQKVFG